MTWLSFCARRPGPSWKTGYGTGDRTLSQIEGVVDHSMEGSLSGAYSVLGGAEQSSWTFSLPKVGEPAQHYEITKIPWHAGLPGDRRHDTSLIGNLTLVGKEVEGKAGEPWTENQLHWSAKIDVALRALCPAFGANPPILRKNMWEHRWLSATSCPSGRNPWAAKFALISSLENAQEDDMAKLIQRAGQGPVFMTDGIWKWGIPSPAVLQDLVRAGLVSGSVISLEGETFDRLQQTHGQPAAGGGATPDEFVDKFKERL
ncbi:hypothetical protein LCGC14_1802800 [marine sediment metagenome]|uniref:N-acetylmuramoyl-L-alanine amidase domain-containing protein n=1 Tax=marine sediment metagenome TaxID=412755 RepID=A0A0F9J3S0_9ZZZZ